MSKTNSFSVTYDIVTPESAEEGDYAESGFLAENVSLREAIDLLGGCASEADCSPFSVTCPPRWFTLYGSMDYRSGETESRSLHLPAGTTPSSALRIARLLGVKN
jgi:hypothetical protein